MISQGIFFIALFLPNVFGVATDEGKKGQMWAVLVAGSNDYFNYRHQADICHAYQIFRRHGVPDSNIIVMMYDNIAYNEENPMKGQIFNKPGGPNVYVNVPKDYTGADVTPGNFLDALAGVGYEKVLKSGPNDHVFVYYADHGGTGLIGFPDDVLYADDLMKTMKKMHRKKMYKKMLIYLECSESGSMFDNILQDNMRIMAVTASNPDESSYACYWNETMETYLGDEYSTAWMEDIDSEEGFRNLTTETLMMQFENVKKRVVDSHPSMYGQTAIDKDHVTAFLGSDSNKTDSQSRFTLGEFKDAVSSRDVPLHTLNKRIALATSEEVKRELEKKRDYLINGRKFIDELFGNILDQVTGMNQKDRKMLEDTLPSLSLEMMPCYKTIVEDFRRSCVNINKNTYALGHLYKFANLCVTGYSSTDDVLKVFSEVCDDSTRALNNVN